jgi:tetratricopeptide (TPR) repeat protein
MSKKILLAEVLLAIIIVCGFRLAVGSKIIVSSPLTQQQIYKERLAVNCSPDWSLLDADSMGEFMKPLPGWGNYGWSINSRSDSAQFYFNQGINMYYAFHIIEAMGSFKKAEQFDAENPMIYWAQALAYGPNINDFVYEASNGALKAAQKALALSGNSTAKEKALIAAMMVRYSTDSSISRKILNERYAAEMKKVYQQFSKDADAGSLYADAMMLLHPWQYWQHNGKPEAWTPAIVEVLEKTLRSNPQHPGANHYYIHTLEASPDPGRALASADRLGRLMPLVSHMVHMPSHIYIRTGNYEKGITVNDMSVNGYNQYLDLYPDVGNNAFLYLVHNYHMKATCALMQPHYKKSIAAATEAAHSFDSSYLSLPQPLGNYMQYVYLIPQMANVRYGKWEEVLKFPEPSSSYRFASLLNSWAKGLAYANTGKLTGAKKELALMNQLLSHPDLQVRMEPFNTPAEQAAVACKILEGMIAQQENDLEKAIIFFTEAVFAEDQLIYTEPRDWLIPARHWLANALIKKKEFANAKKILLEDLAINPHNFNALSGMEFITSKEGNGSVQSNYRKQLQAAFQKSDLPAALLIY